MVNSSGRSHAETMLGIEWRQNGWSKVETGSTSRLLRDLRGFAFDLDGTIWEGPALLPGAVELVADLRAAGLGVVFASNCSRSGSNRSQPAARRSWHRGRTRPRSSRRLIW